MGRGIEPREHIDVGADAVSNAEGNIGALISSQAHRPRRGLRPRHAREGSPGTWEIPSPPGTNRYREAKETERRGKGGRKSELLIVPMKEGNAYRADPAEGRGSRRHGTEGTKDARETELGKRLNKGPADSRTGEEHAAAGADHTRSPHRSGVA